MSVYVDRQRYRHDSRTVTLGSGGTITISLSAKSFLRLSKEDRDLVGSLLEYLERYEQRQQEHDRVIQEVLDGP
jgi:hypothetical protein